MSLRLYPESEYLKMAEEPEPEIRQSKLSNIVLLLLKMGVSDIASFEFLEAPEPEKLRRAFEELYRLKAVDGSGSITEHGKRMSMLPVSVEWANLILKVRTLIVQRRDEWNSP